MKKILLSIVAVFFGLALNAQVSVWDGTAEIWTHGSGTQEDPYLIESAQNLAYIAAKTNESIYNGDGFRMMYVDTCFLLTVNIDLGADAGMEWEPIAANGANWWKGQFSGHFDGGGHSFTNLTISNDGDFFGIFGFMNGGSLKNMVVEGNDINISHIYTYLCGPVGLLLGYGMDVTIENCVNKANVNWETINIDTGHCNLGGLFGQLDNSTINNCHNYGNISGPATHAFYNGPSCGGIAGCLNNCVVDDCSNYGSMNIIVVWDMATRYMYGGGIAGCMTGTISNCSNNGDLFFQGSFPWDSDIRSVGGIIGYTSSESDNMLVVENCYANCNMNIVDDTLQSWAGGIIGYIANTISVTIRNCYYAGSEMLTEHTGGVVCRANTNTSVDNCFYINTIDSQNDYGIPKSSSEMKTQDFVDLLNNGGEYYAMDILYVNQGYPVFARYYDVPENESQANISVYPNPAQDYVRIELSDNSACQSIEIYSLDGRLVETFQETSLQTTIDISGLNAGLYIMKIRMAEGKEYTERIIKE